MFAHTPSHSVLSRVTLQDLCNYSRGEEIQKKLKKLEAWVKDIGVEWVGQSFDCLQHVLQVKDRTPYPSRPHFTERNLPQAAKVLVMSDRGKRKLCEDAAARERECPDLNAWQLRQLLSMYTPTEGEEKLPLDMLAKLMANRPQGTPYRIPLPRWTHVVNRLPKGEKEPLILDLSHAEPLLIDRLHYAEVEDVMTLPFPLSVKQHFEDMQKKARGGRDYDSSDSDDDEKERKAIPRGGSTIVRGTRRDDRGGGESSRPVRNSGGGSTASTANAPVDASAKPPGSSSPRRKMASKFASLPLKRGQKRSSVYDKMFSKDK